MENELRHRPYGHRYFIDTGTPCTTPVTISAATSRAFDVTYTATKVPETTIIASNPIALRFDMGFVLRSRERETT